MEKEKLEETLKQLEKTKTEQNLVNFRMDELEDTFVQLNRNKAQKLGTFNPSD